MKNLTRDVDPENEPMTSLMWLKAFGLKLLNDGIITQPEYVKYCDRIQECALWVRENDKAHN